MKKIFAITFAAVLAVLAISCQKENFLTEEQNDTPAPVQYTFNISVNNQFGLDNDASAKGGNSPTYKTEWTNGDRIFLFFQPTSGSLLTDRYATLTYDGSSWEGTVSSGTSSLGTAGTLSAVYVYNLDCSVNPEFSDNKWNIETGNTFYTCQTGVSYTVSGSEISASLNLVAPADFVRFTIYGTSGKPLTCDQVKGWNDVVIGSEMTFSNATCTGNMTGNANIGNSMYLDYYGRIVGGESSLNGVTCNFSMVVNGEVYEYAATPKTEARSFKMSANNWTPSGKLTGVFTVKAATGSEPAKQVRFSKGNLQATYSTTTNSYTWSFAANQYDFIGNAKGNTSIDSQEDKAVVDLFGWVGASSTTFTSEPQIYGISTSTTTGDYGTGSSDALKADWGKTIDDKGTWRTPTEKEWNYLLFTRGASTVGETANARYAKATVNSKNGLILLPDTYFHPLDKAIQNINNNNSNFSGNNYNLEDWAKMEAAGAVFLPIALTRNGSTVTVVQGNYWTSSIYSINPQGPACVNITMTALQVVRTKREAGNPVRLVTDVK